MNNLMNKFRQFMYGRNGFDQLSLFVFVASLILELILSIFSMFVARIVYLVCLIYIVFRVLSKNVAARRLENEKFLNIIRPIIYNIKTGSTQKADKNYKYYTCKKCKQRIRVPKNKGKIKITCPKCGYSFIKKT